MLQPGETPLRSTETTEYSGKVRDAYTLRCSPQIHGIAHDTVEFVRGLLNVELNSATDNPMVFNGPIGSQWLELGSNTLGARPDLAPAGVGKVEQNASSSSTSAPSSQGKASDRTSASGGKNSAPKMHTPIDSINDLTSAKEEIERLLEDFSIQATMAKTPAML